MKYQRLHNHKLKLLLTILFVVSLVKEQKIKQAGGSHGLSFGTGSDVTHLSVSAQQRHLLNVRCRPVQTHVSEQLRAHHRRLPWPALHAQGCLNVNNK